MIYLDTSLGKVFLYKSIDDICVNIARQIIEFIPKCVNDFGDCHLAIGRKGIPEDFFTALMIDPASRSIPWEKVHVWIADEKKTSVMENQTWPWIRELLIKPSGIPMTQVHRIHTESANPLENLKVQMQEGFKYREPGENKIDCFISAAQPENRLGFLDIKEKNAEKTLEVLEENHNEIVYALSWNLITSSRIVSVLGYGSEVKKTINEILPCKDDLLFKSNVHWHFDCVVGEAFNP